MAETMCDKLKKKITIRIVPDESVTHEDIGLIRQILKRNVKVYEKAGFEVE